MNTETETITKAQPYEILSAATTEELSEKVNARFAEGGYKMVGAPFVFDGNIC
jgi:hypothetical protein